MSGHRPESLRGQDLGGRARRRRPVLPEDIRRLEKLGLLVRENDMYDSAAEVLVSEEARQVADVDRVEFELVGDVPLKAVPVGTPPPSVAAVVSECGLSLSKSAERHSFPCLAIRFPTAGECAQRQGTA